MKILTMLCACFYVHCAIGSVLSAAAVEPSSASRNLQETKKYGNFVGVQIKNDRAKISFGSAQDVHLIRSGNRTLLVDANLTIAGLTAKKCIIQSGMQEDGGVILKESKSGNTLLSCQEDCKNHAACSAFVHVASSCWLWKSIGGTKATNEKTKSIGVCTRQSIDVGTLLMGLEDRVAQLEKELKGLTKISVKGKSKNNPGKSCNEIKGIDSAAPSGIYWIMFTGLPSPIEVYCDMVTDGGGWTLVGVALYKDRGKTGWNAENALNSALWTQISPPQFWHFPSAYMNTLGNTYRMNCYDSNNNYKRYWWGVANYKWAKVTTAGKCNDKYDGSGTGKSFATSWASHHWGIVCGSNEKDVAMTSHSGNHWACAGNAGPGGEGYTGRNGKSNFRLWIKDMQVAKGGSQSNPASSCQEIKSLNSAAKDGTYWISAGGATFNAYCDMTRDGGGWTLAAVNLFKDRGKAGWNNENSLKIQYSSYLKPPDSWHLSRAVMNAISKSASTPNYRVNCFESNNNYIRYWWGVTDYKWTTVTGASKCNSAYNGQGTSFAVAWAGHHFGLTCGNNEKVTVITAHSGNHWACAGNQGPGGEGYTGRGGKSNQRIWIR